MFGYFSDVSDNLHVTFVEEMRLFPLSMNYLIFFLIKSNYIALTLILVYLNTLSLS